jgi:hypothetical protein
MYYLALFSSADGFPLSPSSELVDANYSRQPVVLDGNLQNVATVRFPVLAAVHTVSHIALMTELVGGAVYKYGALTKAITIVPPSLLAFPVGYLTALSTATGTPEGADGVRLDFMVDDWVLGAGRYSLTLTHNLESLDVFARLREGSQIVNPDSVETPSLNTIQFFVPADPDGRFAGTALIERAP